MQLIVRLNGGIGNQMFQYAAGCALAHRNNVPLLIDTTPCEHASRRFGLDVFNISSGTAYAAGLGRVAFRVACSGKPGVRLMSAALRRALRFDVIRESSIHHVEFSVLDIPIRRSLCLQGYWQAPGYFSDAEELIREEFTFKFPSAHPNAAILERIRAVNAVSVHVRRGDYLTVSGSPVLRLPYYSRALALIASRVPTPKVFVFSDDIPWAKANLPRDYETTFVDVNTAEFGYEDLRLMSTCKHHIIANSSFSWWGAWLDARPEKVVVAPKYWMGRPETFYPELIPAGWTLIDNLI